MAPTTSRPVGDWPALAPRSRTLWRAVLIWMVGLGATAGSARAETLGLWSYAPPAGYTAVKKATQHEYTQVTGRSFCLIGVYVPRPAGADLAADLKQEWATVVTAKFAASQVETSPAKTTRRGLGTHGISAALADAAGTYHGQLFVIRERDTVGSILLMSNDAETITSCQPAITALTESIALVGSAAPTPAPLPSEQPTQGSVVASWGYVWSLRDHRTGWSNGYTQAQYDLRADGTYAYKQEQRRDWAPKTQYFTRDEVGTYRVDGATLTLTPQRANGTLRDDKGTVLETSKLALETMSYAWRLVYAEVLKERQLWWTPAKPTQRDGTPNGGTAFPDGFILASPKKLYWKY